MFRSFRPVFAALAVAALAGCASSQMSDTDATMQASQEWRLAKLEENAMAQRNAQLELAGQLNAIEKRLDGIEQGMSVPRRDPAPLMSSQDLPEPAPEMAAPEMADPQEAPRPGMTGAQDAPAGSEWDDYPDAASKSESKPASKVAPAPKAKPAPAAAKPKAVSGKAEYDRALKVLLDGNAAKARPMFESFLSANPKSALAPNALYWLGETYYHEKRYAESIVAFKKVHQQYPQDEKAAASLLKIGYSYAMLGDTNNARFYLEVLTQDYPKSEPAKLARKRLATLK